MWRNFFKTGYFRNANTSGEKGLLKQSLRGLSVIEVLIVVTLLAILFIIAMGYLNRGGLKKARDAERKDDLHEIKLAFEEYYNDNSCYPSSDVLKDCGSANLSPYLNEIPCDPLSAEPYVYIPHPSAEDTCRGYRVYSPLEWEGDPVIEELGCTGGCGLDDEQVAQSDVQQWSAEDYQYGVSEGVQLGDPSGVLILTEGWCCDGSTSSCNSWSAGGVCDEGMGPYEELTECVEAANGCDE